MTDRSPAQLEADIAALKGNVIALQGIVIQLLKALRATGALSPVSADQIVEDVLTAFEARGVDDAVNQSARRGADRIGRALGKRRPPSAS